MIIQDIRNLGWRRTIAWYLVRVAAKIWDDGYLSKLVILDENQIHLTEIEIQSSHWGSGPSSWHGKFGHGLRAALYEADYPDYESDPDAEPVWELVDWPWDE